MTYRPHVFISYSWDDEDHKSWVRELAERLVVNGVRVSLDQWDVVPGDSLTEFMESKLQICDFALVICTPLYANKSSSRAGGVGYEQQIISGALVNGVDRRKFIPIVRQGEFKPGENLAIPPHFRGIFAIDMRGDQSIDEHLKGLLRAVFKVPAITAPPVGRPPKFVQSAQNIEIAKPGIPARLANIEFDGFQLISGVAMNEAYPDTFSIPEIEDRENVRLSDLVKLGFEIATENPDDESGVEIMGERMWVNVKGKYGPYLWGTLSNDPVIGGPEVGLQFGAEVVFLPEHIIDIKSE